MREYRVDKKEQGIFPDLQTALAAVREQEKNFAPGEEVRIVIHGMQRLTETLHIDESMLPDSDHPVLVEGADEMSGFSGGIVLSGFSRWKDNIWCVKVPEVEYTRHLYIDGKFAKRPATPLRKPFRWDALEAEDYVFSNLPGEEEKTITVWNGGEEEPFEVPDWSGIATTHTEIADWKNIRDVEMVFEIGWVHRVVPIERTEPLPDGRLYIKPLEPAFRTARCAEGVQIGGCPSYLDNVFELLGNPLEWYFDRTEQMLYVGFEEGDCPENHTIVIPAAEQLMEIKGALDKKCCHLRFRNLRFEHTTWLFPGKYGMPEIQASQMDFRPVPEELMLEKPYEADYRKVISALRILASRDVSFENCTFTNLGTGALTYEYGACSCRIHGNHFHEIGGSAVIMGDFYLERAHHPKDRREIVRMIDVSGNHIHDTGKECRGSVAVMAGYVQDVTIANNEIYNVPYSAVSLGWGWGSTDVSVGPKRQTPWTEASVCMRNRIVNNHIHHCMMHLCDGGAIYTLGCMTGTVISGNYIHESSGYQGMGFDKVLINGYQTEEVHDPAGDPFWERHGVPGGIYLDEGSSGIEVCDNILHDVAVPLFYHNQIDLGYERVSWKDNVLNKRPGEEGFPEDLAACAGVK